MKIFLALIATTSTSIWVKGSASSVCSEAQNLGDGLSEGQGYLQEYPKSGGVGTPNGYDDTIAFLVGGNYNAPRAAEIEGKAVVLGDFIIGSQGTNSLGTFDSHSLVSIRCSLLWGDLHRHSLVFRLHRKSRCWKWYCSQLW